MRLEILERGHRGIGKQVLRLIRWRWGMVPDTQKTFWYRRSFFGGPFAGLIQPVLRGPSAWTPGERELFAAFGSHQNQCPF